MVWCNEICFIFFFLIYFIIYSNDKNFSIKKVNFFFFFFGNVLLMNDKFCYKHIWVQMFVELGLCDKRGFNFSISACHLSKYEKVILMMYRLSITLLFELKS